MDHDIRVVTSWIGKDRYYAVVSTRKQLNKLKEENLEITISLDQHKKFDLTLSFYETREIKLPYEIVIRNLPHKFLNRTEEEIKKNLKKFLEKPTYIEINKSLLSSNENFGCETETSKSEEINVKICNDPSINMYILNKKKVYVGIEDEKDVAKGYLKLKNKFDVIYSKEEIESWKKESKNLKSNAQVAVEEGSKYITKRLNQQATISEIHNDLKEAMKMTSTLAIQTGKQLNNVLNFAIQSQQRNEKLNKPIRTINSLMNQKSMFAASLLNPNIQLNERETIFEKIQKVDEKIKEEKPLPQIQLQPETMHTISYSNQREKKKKKKTLNWHKR
eukprot:gene12886-7307_t